MMKTILVAGVLAATAFAGVASAAGHCQSGSTPLGYYNVCLLSYNEYSFTCPDGSCSYSSTDNSPINAYSYGPTGGSGLGLDQYTYSSSYSNFFGSGSSSGKGTNLYAYEYAGPAYSSLGFSQYSYSYQDNNLFGSDAGDGKGTNAYVSSPAGYISAGQSSYSYTNSFGSGSGKSTGVNIGAPFGGAFIGQNVNNGVCTINVGPAPPMACGPIPVIPDVPDVPTLPPPPL